MAEEGQGQSVNKKRGRAGDDYDHDGDRDAGCAMVADCCAAVVSSNGNSSARCIVSGGDSSGAGGGSCGAGGGSCGAGGGSDGAGGGSDGAGGGSGCAGGGSGGAGAGAGAGAANDSAANDSVFIAEVVNVVPQTILVTAFENWMTTGLRRHQDQGKEFYTKLHALVVAASGMSEPARVAYLVGIFTKWIKLPSVRSALKKCLGVASASQVSTCMQNSDWTNRMLVC